MYILRNWRSSCIRSLETRALMTKIEKSEQREEIDSRNSRRQKIVSRNSSKIQLQSENERIESDETLNISINPILIQWRSEDFINLNKLKYRNSDLCIESFGQRGTRQCILQEMSIEASDLWVIGTKSAALDILLLSHPLSKKTRDKLSK